MLQDKLRGGKANCVFPCQILHQISLAPVKDIAVASRFAFWFNALYFARCGSKGGVNVWADRVRREIEIKPICADCLLQIAQAFCGTIHTVEEKHRLAVSPLKSSFKKKSKRLTTKIERGGDQKHILRECKETKKEQGKAPSGLCSCTRACSVLAAHKREWGKKRERLKLSDDFRGCLFNFRDSRKLDLIPRHPP